MPGQARSPAGQVPVKYHCPYYQRGIFSGLPQACQKGIAIKGIKHLTVHLKKHHCGNSNPSYANLTEAYVLELKTKPDYDKNMDEGDKWRAIYRTIFDLSPDDATPYPFFLTFEQFLTANMEGVAGGSTEQSPSALATAMTYIRNNYPAEEDSFIEWMAGVSLEVAKHLAKSFNETGGICTVPAGVNGGPVGANEFDPSNPLYVSPDGN